MMTSNPDFEAMNQMARMNWMVNFEAIATVGNDEDAIAVSPKHRVLQG